MNNKLEKLCKVWYNINENMSPQGGEKHVKKDYRLDVDADRRRMHLYCGIANSCIRIFAGSSNLAPQ